MSTARQKLRRAAVVTALIVIGVVAAMPASASASTYNHGAWNIQTSTGRDCGHGTEGVPQPGLGLTRVIWTGTSVHCDSGPGGLPKMTASHYLFYKYGDEVAGTGVGGSYYNGSCSVTGTYCLSDYWREVLNVPTRLEVVPWNSYVLPTTGTEAFTGYPTYPQYKCTAYSRLHDNLNGWHYSGLTCMGEGVFYI